MNPSSLHYSWQNGERPAISYSLRPELAYSLKYVSSWLFLIHGHKDNTTSKIWFPQTESQSSAILVRGVWKRLMPSGIGALKHRKDLALPSCFNHSTNWNSACLGADFSPENLGNDFQPFWYQGKIKIKNWFWTGKNLTREGVATTFLIIKIICIKYPTPIVGKIFVGQENFYKKNLCHR